MLIVVEGIDSTGKTSLAEIIAQKYGIEYFRGGGWQKDSRLAERARVEGANARNRYYSLMQLERLQKLREKIDNEGLVIVDRLVLVDVAHHLAFGWKEDKNDFSDKAKAEALEALDKYLPKEKELGKRGIKREQIIGFVLDVADPVVIEQRIISSLRDEGIKELPQGTAPLREWLRDNDRLPEADTLERFKAKRQAWLWCAQKLGWEVIDASGNQKEVGKLVIDHLREKGIVMEGRIYLEDGGRKPESAG